jgi:hypothetical protein
MVACLAIAPSRGVNGQVVPPARPAATASGFGVLQGFVIDSVHNGAPLVNASVVIEGTTRAGVTTAEGRYRIDSIPPGSHRVVVLHPLLDTLGVSMRSPPYPFGAGESHDLDLWVPSGQRLAAMLCNPAQRSLGPAVMVGFVRDPDTNGPAAGAKVELVYVTLDPIGRKKPPTVRSAVVDTSGLYHICGLPADMSGKVQVFRNGVSSGEVPAEVTDGFVAVRAFSIVAQHQAIVEVKNDSGKVRKVARGSARVTGKVVDKMGKPLSGARVMLQGGGSVTVSRTNGDFVLDSLPAGTQALDVRKLGYAAAEVPVELSATEPFRTTVTLGDFVPVLATMIVEAAQDKALSDIGYLQRKQQGMGYFMDGKDINHDAIQFSDVLRMAPGLKVQPAGDGRTYVVTDSRNPQNGCVNFYVDGTLWTTITPGDIDQFVQPHELVAVEIYHGASTPPQYSPPGQSSCASVVAWTVARVHMDNKKKP